MEVCPEAELIAFEDPATVCDRAFQIGKSRKAQMIRHMRHGSPPRLMVLQSILSPNRGESLPTPSAGACIKPYCAILSCFVFHSGSAAVITDRGLSRCWRERFCP